MANLLPCPFCGNETILFTESVDCVGYHYCKKCWARVGSGCQTYTESVRNWNRRPDIKESAKDITPSAENRTDINMSNIKYHTGV